MSNTNIYARIRRRIKLLIDPLVVRSSMKCLHGPRKITIHNDQLVVVCMVKNGEFFIREFLEHYLQMGVHHIVLVDNGSTDNTVKLASQSPKVTVLQTLLPAKHYESYFRQYAAEAFCRPGGWCLFADMDEFFDYPGRGIKSLKELLGYLNTNGYSAVVSQMVDMYPRGRIEDSDGTPGTGNFLKEHVYYETDTAKLVRYHDPSNPHWYFLKDNSIPDERIQYACGGVRKRVFDTNSWLSKHPLVRLMPNVIPSTHPSCSSGVVCADFMGVLKHYKFAGDFANRVKNEVATKTWDHGETETYHAIVASDSPILYKEGLSKNYVDALHAIDGSFLVAGSRYLRWLGVE